MGSLYVLAQVVVCRFLYVGCCMLVVVCPGDSSDLEMLFWYFFIFIGLANRYINSFTLMFVV